MVEKKNILTAVSDPINPTKLFNTLKINSTEFFQKEGVGGGILKTFLSLIAFRAHLH